MKPFHQADSQKRTLHSTGELPVLCTCTDASLLLRCSPESVARLARSGKLKGVKQGSSWLFRRDDLLKYVDNLFETTTK